jgi:DNA modification methylase
VAGRVMRCTARATDGGGASGLLTARLWQAEKVIRRNAYASGLYHGYARQPQTPSGRWWSMGDAYDDGWEHAEANSLGCWQHAIEAIRRKRMSRVEHIGDATLYCGDCLEILPTLGKVDAVVTDPPYGIGEHGGACRTRGRPGYTKHKNLGWDIERPPDQLFSLLLNISNHQIIWGGNYFADLLPPTSGWLYWRKLMGGDFSDGELAWTSKTSALREFVKCPKNMDKEHPTQKPVELMKWCLQQIPCGAQSVLDPYMGSGSTGVACVNMGMKFIGIEREPAYFDIACRRIEAAYKQPRLFQEPAPKPVQEKML